MVALPDKAARPVLGGGTRVTRFPTAIRSSERLAREQEQLELAIGALEADQAERLAASPIVAAAIQAPTAPPKPARPPLAGRPPRPGGNPSPPRPLPPPAGAPRR